MRFSSSGGGGFFVCLCLYILREGERSRLFCRLRLVTVSCGGLFSMDELL